MQIQAFIGPSNTSAAINASADRSINVFEEPVAPGTGKGKDWDRSAPGLRIFASLQGSGVSVDLFAQDERCFAVAGSTFYEVFSDGSSASFGTVSTMAGIVPTMCSNGTAGHQVFITSGLNGYIFDTVANTLTLIADVDFPQGEALAGEFMDGYFLVLVYQSRRFQISALEDGTDWDGLDIAERSEASDNLVAMRRSHRDIPFLGTQTGEVWYDNGDPDFPFAPVQGVFLEQGASATGVLQRIGNSYMWVGMSADGAGVVYLADGYTPTRVSTSPIEDQIQAAGASAARAWTYEENGHVFYLLHLDNNDTTLVFDLTTGKWHERAVLVSEDPDVWVPNRPISHCYVFGKHLVGDRLTGTIYEQSVEILTQDLAA